MIYDFGIRVCKLFVDTAERFGRRKPATKFRRFVRGQRGLIESIEADFATRPKKPVVWFHAASLGEYAIAKPLISGFKQKGWHVVMTFFSPSGYEALRHRHPDIDRLYYLPLDTRRNARRFLTAVKPDRVVFIKSEYWLNYLREIRDRNIPTFLVSAKINRNSVFFRPYGYLFRKSLQAFSRIFVLDEASVTNLADIGYTRVTLSGNPLFDNAIQKADEPWSDPVIERFKQSRPVFVAGSIHDATDAAMMIDLANANPDTRFIFVPHAIHERDIAAMTAALRRPALRHSQCAADTDFSDVQTLVIDFVGALAYIYRYGDWAYIGGGFTPLLHSVIEATVYGLPVSFGPRIERKVTPMQLIDLGIGTVVRDSAELQAWFASLKDNAAQLAAIRATARGYVARNANATAAILAAII